MTCSYHDSALTTYCNLTCSEKLFAINCVTEENEIPKLKRHCHLRQHIACIETITLFGMCVCVSLFVTICNWGVATIDSVSSIQPEDVWSETKSSVQTYQQNELYPLFGLQFCFRKLLWTTNWGTECETASACKNDKELCCVIKPEFLPMWESSIVWYWECITNVAEISCVFLWALVTRWQCSVVW